MAKVLKRMVARDGVELYSGIDSVEVIDSNNTYNALNSMMSRLTVREQYMEISLTALSKMHPGRGF
jgi:hypothetical protein